MGIKRPLEEELEEASFKQPKQLVSENKLTSFAGAFPSYDVSQANDERGEDGFHKSQLCKELEDDIDAALNLVDKELETSAPLSWVTSSSSEEDAGSGEPLYLPLFQEYFEFNFPRRTLFQFEDASPAMLNSSPRRQVPVGPNHQADIPLWSPDAIQKQRSSSSPSIDDENEQKFLGTPIFSSSVSENSAYGDFGIGQGRRDCRCLDEGSMRCVQQHVKEARQKFREDFGEENFADLGFYDMGEEVAHRWSEEEERIFHEVIFSNPASLGKNFWRQLSAVFPSRTKKELVSYYFNVFMLQRRAVQNRSNLEIDSDDDEWHGNNGDLNGVGEDEDSVVESDEDIQEGSEDEDGIEGHDKENDDDDDDDDDSDDGEGDGDFGNKHIAASAEDATVNHELSCQHSKPQCQNLPDVVGSDCVVRKDSGTQEDSSTSSETQQLIQSSLGSIIRADTQSRGNEDFKGCYAGENNGSNEDSVSGSVFLLESCDAYVWDGSCSTDLVKGVVDLLPTCNMIEEIFGPFTSKTN